MKTVVEIAPVTASMGMSYEWKEELTAGALVVVVVVVVVFGVVVASWSQCYKLLFNRF